MKAITVYQPWATLLACGVKKVEPRWWRTRHEGAIAIHAARTFSPYAKAVCALPLFREAMERHGYTPETLPTGAVVGIATLKACPPIAQILSFLTMEERSYGCFLPDYARYALIFEDAVRLVAPCHASGAQKIWNLPKEIKKKVMEGLAQEELAKYAGKVASPAITAQTEA